MGQTNRNSKNGCATRLNYKKVKYPQTLLLKVHYETSVPTVLDRFIQQAVMQVLQRRWDRTFSPLEKFFDRVNHDKLIGPDRQPGRGQAAVETHPGILECRGNGERVGQPERGRNSARRSSFAPVK